LPKALRYKDFLSHVRSALGAPSLRHSGEAHRVIRSVAVCGGSGSDLLGAAIAAGAQAFVTADVRYHAFQEPDGRIAMIDAGHFETEVPAVAAIAATLRRDPRVRAARVRIIVSRSSKNPVQYFPS
jgi:putative NIF3 family GTP cyclohydrolase 1 type 2